jgi:hypothetical protein
MNQSPDFSPARSGAPAATLLRLLFYEKAETQSSDADISGADDE